MTIAAADHRAVVLKGHITAADQSQRCFRSPPIQKGASILADPDPLLVRPDPLLVIVYRIADEFLPKPPQNALI